MNELTIPRELLARALNGDVRVTRFFEDQVSALSEVQSLTTSTLSATGAIQDATVITLSKNKSFQNERVLATGNGIEIEVTDDNVIIRANRSVVMANGGFRLTATLEGDSALAFPLEGIVATRSNVETLTGKTLDAPLLSGIADYVDDAAAAIGGVPIGSVYRTASVLKFRVA